MLYNLLLIVVIAVVVDILILIFIIGPGGWIVELPGALQEVVWEAGQLLQGGFRPPPLAVHLTLHYHTLQTAAMGLHVTLRDYHSVLDNLSPVQVCVY